LNTNNQAKFITLGQLILQKISIRTLATGIENEGIYTWDRFDRLAVTCETNKAFILDLLADQYKYETHFGAYVERNGTPLSPLEKYELVPQSAEEAKDWDWDNPFDQFGWPADALPNFNNPQAQNECVSKKIAANSSEENETPEGRRKRLKERVEHEKTKDTHNFLVVVAAEENISKSRLKQLVYDKRDKKICNNNQYMQLVATKSQTSSKKSKPQS
jgi:hypothetical protein